MSNATSLDVSPEQVLSHARADGSTDEVLVMGHDPHQLRPVLADGEFWELPLDVRQEYQEDTDEHGKPI
jgi:hypothetical protein